MNLQDVKFQGLTSALAVSGGQVDDLESQYLVSLGATLGDIQDMWHEVWDSALVTAGNYNDRAYEWLGTNGHNQDQLNERWYSYWSSL